MDIYIYFNRLRSSALPLQKLLFSATLTENPEKLEKLNLCEPRLFTSIVKSDTATEAEQQKEHFAGKYTTPHGLQVCISTLYDELMIPTKNGL